MSSSSKRLLVVVMMLVLCATAFNFAVGTKIVGVAVFLVLTAMFSGAAGFTMLIINVLEKKITPWNKFQEWLNKDS